MSSSNTNLDLLNSGQAQKEITTNALFDAMSSAALYGRRASTTAGLTWGFYGGFLPGIDNFIDNGTVTLLANATNILQFNKTTGAVSVATTLTEGNVAVYRIVTNSNGVASGVYPGGGYQDCRPNPLVGGSSSGYTLPTASETVKGGVKIDAATLSITNDILTVLPVTKIPQNAQTTDYTLILSDSGKHIFHPSSDTTARIFTIPSNANVAYAIGTSITFINQNAGGVVTIKVTSDVMRLAGDGTTGDRLLAANGMATAIKITSTEWIISGNGLT